MTTTVLLATALMISALTFYTIGVWSEKFAGQLKWWHLIFFWLGFTADTIGTSLMFNMAGSFTINLHSVTGVAAVLLMFIHAVWATIVLLRKDTETASKFHRFSVLVWAIWLIPFVSGLALAMFGQSFSISALTVSPDLHLGVGTVALIATLASLAVAGWFAWKKQPLSSLAFRIFIVTQLALMLQILVGVSLLDKGFGLLQVYVHYLGGMAPVAFFLLFYWLRTNDKLKETRLAAFVTGAAFVFVLMTYAIGGMYVAG
jgi:uncharacterized repeat protein (TIGR03987 family)